MKRISFKTEYAEYAGAKLSRRDGIITVRLSYNAAFGMGEKYDAVNQKGRRAVNRVEEKFCFQGDKTYCSAPFFFTDTGFGLYADTDEITTFYFEDEIGIELPETADVIVFSGTPESIISEYMSLFGKPALPPDWVFEPWISANRWNTQAEAEEQIQKLREYDFPAGVIVLEAWSDEATFYLWNGARYTPKPNGGAFTREELSFSEPWSDPEGMIKRLHGAGLHLLLWQVPVYKKQGPDETVNVQNELDRADAAERGLCVRNADSSPYVIPDGHWFSGSMIPDFRKAETRESWFNKRRYLLDMGVDGFKTDGGEFILSGSRVNSYAREYCEAYRDFVGETGVIFSRAGFSGQHTVPIHWAGDQQSVNSELKSVLNAGLSAGLSGVIFWGFDLGGFAGPLPSLDLYRRATQLACFCPIMQWHSEPDGGQFRELMPGCEGNNERSPWNMAKAYDAPEFIAEMRFWHRLRMAMKPYLARTARECTAKNRPMLRHLAYSFPGDRNAVFRDDEFMLGDTVLAAPYLEENAREREVYLPEGEWIGLFDRKKYSGRQTVRAGDRRFPPVFVRPDCELLSIDIDRLK